MDYCWLLLAGGVACFRGFFPLSMFVMGWRSGGGLLLSSLFISDGGKGGERSGVWIGGIIE